MQLIVVGLVPAILCSESMKMPGTAAGHDDIIESGKNEDVATFNRHRKRAGLDIRIDERGT